MNKKMLGLVAVAAFVLSISLRISSIALLYRYLVSDGIPSLSLLC